MVVEHDDVEPGWRWILTIQSVVLLYSRYTFAERDWGWFREPLRPAPAGVTCREERGAAERQTRAAMAMRSRSSLRYSPRRVTPSVRAVCEMLPALRSSATSIMSRSRRSTASARVRLRVRPRAGVGSDPPPEPPKNGESRSGVISRPFAIATAR